MSKSAENALKQAETDIAVFGVFVIIKTRKYFKGFEQFFIFFYIFLVNLGIVTIICAQNSLDAKRGRTALKTLYDISFWTGLILPAVSLIFSAVMDIFDFSFDALDTDFDLGFDSGILPSSPTAAFAFLLLFGGAGRLLCSFSWFIHLPLAFTAGAAGMYAVNRLIRKLKRVKAESVKSEAFVGKWGVITQAVGENGYGAVTFKTKVGRSTFIAIANEPIKRGEEVEVVRCENGKMFVKKAHPFRQERSE